MDSRIKKLLCNVGTIAICVLAYVMTSNVENATPRPSFYSDPQEDWYGLTAKTISKSSMMSSDRAAAIQEILSNAPKGYYQSIIAIVNSSMMSSDKLTAIRRESAKFANAAQN